MTPITTPPPIQEIVSRIDTIRKKMDAQGLDTLVCHDPANIFYLTHFANFVHERPFILLIPSRGNLQFIIPRLEAPHVESRSIGPVSRVPYREFPAPEKEGWEHRLKECLQGCQTIGVEEQAPFSLIRAMEEEKKIQTTRAVEEARQIKSDYELGRISYTCSLVDQGHAQLLKGARPGRMIMAQHSKITSSLTRKLILDIPNANMLNTRFAAVAQPPEVTHDPHNFTDVFMKFSQGGPHVSIANGVANGYGAEIERTFFINTVPEAAKAPFDHMLEARALAFSLVRPGISMDEVDKRVNEFFRLKGYGANLLHRTGHGFGVTEHEGPFLAEGYSQEIQPRMVFSIEPGIYLPGIGGFRFSDTIRVTDQGAVCMTHGPERLEELTLPRRRAFTDTLKTMAIRRAKSRSLRH